MKTTVLGSLFILSASTSVFPAFADRGWRKFSRETCAELLGHLRPKPITIDRIFDEIDGDGRGTIRDCGPGCWEYEDASTLRNSPQQIENERKVASAYAESILIKNEGLFLFSRYNGFDAPAWDGLTFRLDTGDVTSKVSFKRGVSSYLLIEQGFSKILNFSVAGGLWPKQAFRWAKKNPPRGWSFERAFAHATEHMDKIGRWLLVDDERIKSRIVFMQPDHAPMEPGLLNYAKRLVVSQTGQEVESVTLIDDKRGEIHEIVNGTAEVSLRRSRREEQ